MKRWLLLLTLAPLGCGTCPQAHIVDKVFTSRNACAPCAQTAQVAPPAMGPGAPLATAPAAYASPTPASCSTCASGGQTVTLPAGAMVQGPSLQQPPTANSVLANHGPELANTEELPKPKSFRPTPAKNLSSSEDSLTPASDEGKASAKEAPAKRKFPRLFSRTKETGPTQ